MDAETAHAHLFIYFLNKFILLINNSSVDAETAHAHRRESRPRAMGDGVPITWGRDDPSHGDVTTHHMGT